MLNPFPKLQEKADLGELNFSLCYLPTAGRLTVTIIKASNLKAMDLTGFSGAFPFRSEEARLWDLREWGGRLDPGSEGGGTRGERDGDPDLGETSEGGSRGSVLSLPPSPDPYVKASLISEGRRLKKRKTSIKKNTLNPTYNEALVFDVAPESVENVGLSIAVVDYDW